VIYGLLYRLAQFPITYSDLQCHSAIASISNCIFLH